MAVKSCPGWGCTRRQREGCSPRGQSCLVRNPRHAACVAHCSPALRWPCAFLAPERCRGRSGGGRWPAATPVRLSSTTTSSCRILLGGLVASRPTVGAGERTANHKLEWNDPEISMDLSHGTQANATR
eukprot:scaffold2063_cov401-Prasinococcus_capsulatus_cf.AAC.11